ncbi:MAG: SHOCT domain-containing protein [Phycisphaerae bacterium]
MAPMAWFSLTGQTDGSELVQRFGGPGLALLVAVIVMALVMLWARRRSRNLIQRSGPQGPPDIGFTLERLRELRRSGQISEEEFNRLRQIALGLDGSARHEVTSASSTPPNDVDGKTNGKGGGLPSHKEL